MNTYNSKKSNNLNVITLEKDQKDWKGKIAFRFLGKWLRVDKDKFNKKYSKPTSDNLSN